MHRVPRVFLCYAAKFHDNPKRFHEFRLGFTFRCIAGKKLPNRYPLAVVIGDIYLSFIVGIDRAR